MIVKFVSNSFVVLTFYIEWKLNYLFKLTTFSFGYQAYVLQIIQNTDFYQRPFNGTVVTECGMSNVWINITNTIYFFLS